MAAVAGVPWDFKPTSPEEFKRAVADPMWRLHNLYYILIKGEEDDDGTKMLFRPNRAQRRFISRLWHRNIILKARQLGFTTLVCILWLDHALFKANQRCGIVAHNRDAAKVIFRDKVLFAYDSLPAQLLEVMPTKERNADELVFAHNNSSIRVATSMRSGTLHRLLVSEYGDICAHFPDKAQEVKSGSLPSVPANGIAIIESTAKGQAGDFHKMTMKAKSSHELQRQLGVKDWRFHFYAWWQEPKYRSNPDTAIFTTEDDDYFEDLELTHGIKTDLWQRAWYVAQREGDFGGDEQTMWQQYPSTPEEAFKVSTEGTYYAKQLAQARKEKRITVVPYMPGYPVNTFWDLGLNDLNAIWFHQRIGQADRFINYYENSGEPPAHYVAHMQTLGYVWGHHYLPHDGAHRQPDTKEIKTYQTMLSDLGLKNIEIVPVIERVTDGIQLVRQHFPNCWFDEKRCAKGIAHLQNYRKQWNTHLATWSDHPQHDVASNAADSFRQFAQGYRQRGAKRPKRKANWRA